MATICICYGTTDGQTAEVADYVAATIRDLGHAARVVDLKDGGMVALNGVDAMLVGASIHMNSHPGYVVNFVKANLATLHSLPSAFVSVSLSAYGDPVRATSYIEQFCAETGWRPDSSIAVAGALRYTRYGVVKRGLMKQVAREKKLSTDTSVDAVYTDWNAVRTFTEDFISRIGVRT